MCCLCIDRIFDDKRIAVFVLLSWLLLVLGVFKTMGLFDTRFMTFGPSPDTLFMGVALDSWDRWWLVAVFTFLNSSVNDFMSDALSTWILNTITDHKNQYLPYSKAQCLAIAQAWGFYVNIMSIIGLFLVLTQVDFVVIRVCADLFVNTYTNLKFMKHKRTCLHKYQAYQSSEELTEIVGEGKHERAAAAAGDQKPLFVIQEDELSGRA